MSEMNRILLVDDSAAIRRDLRGEFERAGWLVCGEAADGAEALAKVETLKPQVILLDLSMPGLLFGPPLGTIAFLWLTRTSPVTTIGMNSAISSFVCLDRPPFR